MNETQKAWWEDRVEVHAFAEYLVDSGEFEPSDSVIESLRDLLYYFEKPWKWSAEYARWKNVKSGFGGAYSAYIKY